MQSTVQPLHPLKIHPQAARCPALDRHDGDLPIGSGLLEQCNTEMNLGLFPEEVTAIAAVLHRDHYRFK